MEEDARTFRPFGEKIHSYKRVLRNKKPDSAKGKQKESADSDENGSKDDEGVEVEYEVWHVSLCVLPYVVGWST